MRYRRLGHADLIVSELGFGALGIGGKATGNGYGETDDACSVAAIETSLDLGCTFFDTADIYGNGHSERLLGRTLADAGRLHDTVIATKGGSVLRGGRIVQDFSSDHLTRAIDLSLRRLRRDWLDLYLLHNPSLEQIRDGRIFEALEGLTAAGKVRYYGVSVHSVDEARASLAHPAVAAIQIVHNIFAEAQAEPPSDVLFPLAHDHGVAVIAREPLANGFLTSGDHVNRVYGPGDFRATLSDEERDLRIRLANTLRPLERSGVSLAQLALRFVLDEPCVTTAIVGIKTPAQARENFGAVDLSPFSAFYAPEPVRSA